MAVFETINSSAAGLANTQHTSVFSRDGYYYVVYGDTTGQAWDSILYYKFASTVLGLVDASELLVGVAGQSWKDFDVNYSSSEDNLIIGWRESPAFAEDYPSYAHFGFNGDGTLSEDYEYRVTGPQSEAITISRTPSGKPVIAGAKISTNTLHLGVALATSNNPPAKENWNGNSVAYFDGFIYAGVLYRQTSLLYKSETEGYWITVARNGEGLPYTIQYFLISGADPIPGVKVDTGIEVTVTGVVSANFSNAIYIDGKIYMVYSIFSDPWVVKLFTMDTSDNSTSVEIIDTPIGLDPNYGINQVKLAWFEDRPIVYIAYDYDDVHTTHDFLNVFVKNGDTWDNLTTKLTGDLAVDYNNMTTIQTPTNPTLDEVYMQTDSTDLRGSEANWSFSSATTTIDFTGTPLRGDAPLLVNFTSTVTTGTGEVS